MRPYLITFACLCSVLAFVTAVPLPASNQELDVLQIPLSNGKELDVLTLGGKDQEQMIAERNKRTIGLLRDLFPDITKQIDGIVNRIIAQVIRVAGPDLLRSLLGNNSGNPTRPSLEADFEDDDDEDNDDDLNKLDGTSPSSTTTGTTRTGDDDVNTRVQIDLPTFPPESSVDASTASTNKVSASESSLATSSIFNDPTTTTTSSTTPSTTTSFSTTTTTTSTTTTTTSSPILIIPKANPTTTTSTTTTTTTPTPTTLPEPTTTTTLSPIPDPPQTTPTPTTLPEPTTTTTFSPIPDPPQTTPTPTTSPEPIIITTTTTLSPIPETSPQTAPTPITLPEPIIVTSTNNPFETADISFNPTNPIGPSTVNSLATSLQNEFYANSLNNRVVDESQLMAIVDSLNRLINSTNYFVATRDNFSSSPSTLTTITTTSTADATKTTTTPKITKLLPVNN